MKRFVLITWRIAEFKNFEFARHTEEGIRVFARKKEALDLGTTTGFTYRAVRVWIP